MSNIDKITHLAYVGNNDNNPKLYYYLGLIELPRNIKNYDYKVKLIREYFKLSYQLKYLDSCGLLDNTDIANTFRFKANSVNKQLLLKWLSEGQQGYYTPTGLVKELS